MRNFQNIRNIFFIEILQGTASVFINWLVPLATNLWFSRVGQAWVLARGQWGILPRDLPRFLSPPPQNITKHGYTKRMTRSRAKSQVSKHWGKVSSKIQHTCEHQNHPPSLRNINRGKKKVFEKIVWKLFICLGLQIACCSVNSNRGYCIVVQLWWLTYWC